MTGDKEPRSWRIALTAFWRRAPQMLIADMFRNMINTKNFGPKCEFVGLYVEDMLPPLYEFCDQTGNYAMTTSCCGEAAVLCAAHLKKAMTSDWAGCRRCQHLAQSWDEVTAGLQRVTVIR